MGPGIVEKYEQVPNIYEGWVDFILCERGVYRGNGKIGHRHMTSIVGAHGIRGRT